MTDQEYMEIRERERNEIIDAIITFCKHAEWSAQIWKDQDHIKPLFDIARKYSKEGKETVAQLSPSTRKASSMRSRRREMSMSRSMEKF